MPSAGKRALALLLCLTTLSALSGCMSAELVTSQPTATAQPLPTPTLEATPTAFQTAAPTAAASEAVVAAPTPLPPEPSPTQSPVPATPEASQPEATPAKTPAPAASTAAPAQEGPVIPAIPTAKEAMSAFSGHCLNELEEIASMRAELGVRDARSGKDSVIHFWRAGDGFAALVLSGSTGYTLVTVDGRGRELGRVELGMAQTVAVNGKYVAYLTGDGLTISGKRLEAWYTGQGAAAMVCICENGAAYLANARTAWRFSP